MTGKRSLATLAACAAALAVVGAIAIGTFTTIGRNQRVTKAAAASLPGPSGSPSASSKPTTAQGLIRAVAEKAIRLDATIALPPASALAAGQSTTNGRSATAAELKDQTSAGRAAIAAIFAGPAAKQEQLGLNTSVQMQGNGQFRVLGGGATHVDVKDIAVNGSTATVTAQADEFSRIAVKNPDGKWIPARPMNTLDVTMTLSHATGTWLVQTFNFDFANGTGP